MAQGIAHPLRPVPLQAVQVITDRVILVFIGGDLDSPLNPFHLLPMPRDDGGFFLLCPGQQRV